MTEAQIQAKILREIGGRTDCRLFRNSVGTGWQGKATRLKKWGRIN